MIGFELSKEQKDVDNAKLYEEGEKGGLFFLQVGKVKFLLC
jgi:hypothetical protein